MPRAASLPRRSDRSHGDGRAQGREGSAALALAQGCVTLSVNVVVTIGPIPVLLVTEIL
jgi:hypothetical protein